MGFTKIGDPKNGSLYIIGFPYSQDPNQVPPLINFGNPIRLKMILLILDPRGSCELKGCPVWVLEGL